MRAGQSGAAYSFPNVSAISATNASGTLVSGLLASESTTPIVAVFADNGTRVVPTSIQYTYAASTSVKHYVAKLKPSTAYGVTSTVVGSAITVTVTESGGGTAVTSDSAGVAVFDR